MKTVLFVAPGYYRRDASGTFVKNGEATLTMNYLASMANSKKFKYVFYGDAAEKGAIKIHNSLQAALTKFRQKLLFPDLSMKVLTLKEDFDIVHVHSFATKINGIGNVPLVYSCGSNNRCLLQNYLGWDAERIEKAYSRGEKFYNFFGINDALLNQGNAAGTMLLSEIAKQAYIERGISEGKLHTVPPGMPTPNLHQRKTRGEINILFVGLNFRLKGGYVLLEAFKRLRKKFPKLRLTVVTTKETIAELPGIEGVTYLLPQPCEKMLSDIYPNADIFALPSFAEGFGLVNAEAMSFALPVVSSNIYAIPEAVEHGKNGFLVEPGNVAELTHALGLLAGDAALREKMGREGRKIFLKKFTLERQRQAMENILQGALQ